VEFSLNLIEYVFSAKLMKGETCDQVMESANSPGSLPCLCFWWVSQDAPNLFNLTMAQREQQIQPSILCER
jgi:hypothetical protein